jgi:hypothetical protein
MGLATIAVAAGSLAACSNGSTTEATPDATTTNAANVSSKPSGPPPAAQFTTTVNNPYYPLVPGTKTYYRKTTAAGTENIVIEVTRRTRDIQGVKALVVHDSVRLNGELVEDTFDWYAQDNLGNVWYFGEDTREYENGKVSSTHGSWEHGKDGALAGIIMRAQPTLGDEYRQEYYAGEAEDQARVVSTNGTAKVASGSYKDLVITDDFTKLEPDLVENKYYARGIGVVLELDIQLGGERLELVKIERA